MRDLDKCGNAAKLKNWDLSVPFRKRKLLAGASSFFANSALFQCGKSQAEK